LSKFKYLTKPDTVSDGGVDGHSITFRWEVQNLNPNVGATVGAAVGAAVGLAAGGLVVGETVAVGETVGAAVGLTVGETVGAAVGLTVGEDDSTVNVSLFCDDRGDIKKIGSTTSFKKNCWN